MKGFLLWTAAEIPPVTPASGYWVGAVIALLILGYLLYTLIKPEKF